MSSSWPVGVTTQEDMHRYAQTLFGNCKIENLLTGMPLYYQFPGDHQHVRDGPLSSLLKVSLQCKCCPGCGAKADFLECEFCGAWMCVQCLGEHIWLNHCQAERLRDHIRRESHLQHTCSTPSSPAAICVSNLDAETSFEPIPSAAMASGMSIFQLTKPT